MLALLLITLNNCLLHPAKVGVMADPSKNTVYLLVIYLILTSGKASRGPLSALLILYASINPAERTVPALTNTLFLIHPVLLYASVIGSAVCTSSGKGLHKALLINSTATAMCLGGYWSVQELNWGGWWNWDVLECGIGYLLLYLVYTIHANPLGTNAVYSHRSCTLLVLSLWYTALNKSGLGVSIHSFVASSTLQRHYAAAITMAAVSYLTVASSALIGLIQWIAPLSALYLFLKSASFLKPVLALSVVAFLTRSSLRTYAAETQHALIAATISLILAFNYSNSISFASIHHYSYSTSCTDWSSWHPVAQRNSNVPQRFVWKDITLSKPRYHLTHGYTSYSKRAEGTRTLLLQFAK